MRVDIHQHIWTEPLLERLAARSQPPLVSRRRGLTLLHCPHEQPCVIEDVTDAPDQRAELVRSDGLDLALVALSSPAGIEALPGEEARELIAAHLDGVGALPAPFAAWGPIALEDAEPSDVDALLRAGCVGVSLPAGALAEPDWLERVGPLLERVAALDAALLVHPGPAPGLSAAGQISLTEPLWWRALTDYVAQMQAAWLLFATRGRREHPNLTVVFAMLAGGAPLLAERLATRGGPPVNLADPLVFYDTSSYGSAAVEAMARLVGERQLVFGSDRPVVEPIATERDPELQANGAHLIARSAALAAGATAA